MQTDQRHSVLERKLFSIDAFPQSRGVGRAALEREIFPAHDAVAPADLAEAQNEIRRKEVGDLSFVVTNGASGSHAQFLEGFSIKQTVDALSDGQASLSMLTRHAVFAAHAFCQCALSMKFVNFVVPGHSCEPTPFAVWPWREESKGRTMAEPEVFARLSAETEQIRRARY